MNYEAVPSARNLVAGAVVSRRPVLARFLAQIFPWMLLLSLLSRTGFAAESSLFEQANRLYEQGKFAEAIPLYESMLKAGWRSPAVLFNLGNAHFKAGHLGQAIFNYELAASIAPRDPDIQANLDFARGRIEGSASVQAPAWERAATYFTLNETAIACALFFWVWILLLILIRWRPALKPTLRGSVVACGWLLAICLVTLAAGCVHAREEIAVVTVKQGIIHLGPLEESQAAFTVPDGTELAVEAHRGEWLQVTDRSNRSGWIGTNQVALLK